MNFEAENLEQEFNNAQIFSTKIQEIENFNFKNDSKIPKYITEIIVESQIETLNDDDEKLNLFLCQLNKMKPNLNYNTVKKYIILLKPTFFKNAKLTIDENYFKNEKIQDRYLAKEQFDKFIKFIILHKNNPMTWPIIFTMYTGLRLNEICQLTINNLNEIIKNKKYISLQRKNKQQWEPVYHPELINFARFLKDQCINQKKVFPYNKNTIHYNLRKFYIECFNQIPPIGFGLHFVRYSIATLFESIGQGYNISKALGHKSIKTKEIYIKDQKNIDNLLNLIQL